MCDVEVVADKSVDENTDEKYVIIVLVENENWEIGDKRRKRFSLFLKIAN